MTSSLKWTARSPTPQVIRRAIDKRLNIEMVYGLKARDFEVEKSAEGVHGRRAL